MERGNPSFKGTLSEDGQKIACGSRWMRRVLLWPWNSSSGAVSLRPSASRSSFEVYTAFQL